MCVIFRYSGKMYKEHLHSYHQGNILPFIWDLTTVPTLQLNEEKKIQKNRVWVRLWCSHILGRKVKIQSYIWPRLKLTLLQFIWKGPELKIQGGVEAGIHSHTQLQQLLLKWSEIGTKLL